MKYAILSLLFSFDVIESVQKSEVMKFNLENNNI